MSTDPVVIPDSQKIQNPIEYTLKFAEWVMTFDEGVEMIMEIGDDIPTRQLLDTYRDWIWDKAIEFLKRDGRSLLYANLLRVNTADLIYNVKSGRLEDLKCEAAVRQVEERIQLLSHIARIVNAS